MLGDELEFTPDERGVDPDYFDFALNEWDSYATEEAVRIKEAAGDGEVVVVTCGDEDAEDALRRCLAMGADRGVRVDGESSRPGMRSRRPARSPAWSAARALTSSSAVSSRPTRYRVRPAPRSPSYSGSRASRW